MRKPWSRTAEPKDLSVAGAKSVESDAAQGDTDSVALPFPPFEMRELVGPTDVDAFDNATGEYVYPELPHACYASVFDFGCGCGRVARQMIQQKEQPTRYVGVDLHLGMVQWAQRNLTPAAPRYQFLHHDVFNLRFNPDGVKPPMLPFPVEDGEFTLVHALSVFTHLTQEQATFYMAQVARILSTDGIFLASWFLFDKMSFPFMPDSHNALYVDFVDPTAAVIFDRHWVEELAMQSGLVIFRIEPPRIHGHQWTLEMRHAGVGVEPALWPADEAPVGKAIPPAGRFDAHRIQ